jgi:hypothetical protein
MSIFFHSLLLRLRFPLSAFFSDSMALLLSFFATKILEKETDLIWKPVRIPKRIQTLECEAKNGETLQCEGSWAKAGF